MAAEDFVVDNLRLCASFQLKTAFDLQSVVRSTPQRYILDASATRLCAAVAIQDARTIQNSLDILRLPSERFWIEWMERPRFETLKSMRPNLPDPAALSTDTRAGALIEAEPGGRSGTAWLFTGHSNTADFCPLYLEFSTEVWLAAPPRGARLEAFSICNPDFPSLKGLLDHCLAQVDPSWSDYCAKASQSVDEANRRFEDLAGKVWFDWPFILAFLLLNQVPAALDVRPSDLGALNRARAKKGKQSLLDHLEVSASLIDRKASQSGSGDAMGYAGKRLHHIRGHLVRRNARVFWRSPHLRGNPALGAIATRTVRVRA